MNTPDSLDDLIVLALAVAYGPDRLLSTDEVETLVDRLHARMQDQNRAAVQARVVAQLAGFAVPGAAERAADRLAQAPESNLPMLLDDVVAMARADGLVHQAEGDFVEHLARRWKLDPPETALKHRRADGLLVDLALLCVALGYGADHDLSASESRMIQHRLAEWAAVAGLRNPAAALDTALRRYGTGREQETRHAAIRRLKAGLEADVRALVLRDLAQIANADGRFLDEEENLLAYIASVWSEASAR